VRFARGDVAEFGFVAGALPGHDVVCHLAGQVAVTTSVEDPAADFRANAQGTLSVLEAARAQPTPPIVLYASTNKVYGGLEGAAVREEERRYAYADGREGVSEREPLDFHSPYACSKGVGDQYALDYCRVYGVPTVVFRQSCIYGPHQLGCEDQGWLAHFAICAVLDRPITICGDGKQVRDLLHVRDLIRLYDLAIGNIERAMGRAFNTGGGPSRARSLREVIATLEEITGRPLRLSFTDWRPGDQRIYVSDTAAVRQALGWEPTVEPEEGVRELCGWVEHNRDLF
jgi:CDP-paratose 2-epimerase